jgi:alpha-L-fucosidase
LCLYYSIVDWHSPLYPNQGRSHELPPQPGDRPDLARYIEFVKGQVRELCTNYGKIGGFWWDMRVDKVDDHFINDMILSLQPAAVINNRGFDAGDYGTPERDYNRSAGLAPHLKGRVEACQSVGMESWGYRKDEDFYSHRHLTSSIAKFRACDANYLLNVGPGADGAIPEKPAQILRKIGAWYKSADNRSILLTRKSNSVYVHLVEPPEGEELRLYPLAAAPLRAVLLNDGRPIEWRFDIAPMEWSGHKPYLRLHRLPVEEFAGTTMIVRLDFPNGEFAKVSRARKNGAVDPAAGVLAQ